MSIVLAPGDVLFECASVIDGTGATPRFTASVLVRAGKIHKICKEPLPPAQAHNEARIVDCKNASWVLSPGFIDMHAHSDLSLLHTPEHLAKITQGVTTEVIGQDGISYAPVDDVCLSHIRSQIAGWNGNPQDDGFWSRWRTVKEYLNVLDNERIATNAAFLVPQGNLRMLVLGYDPRAATKEEIQKMKEILVRSLEEGAVGMSSGLTYVPGMYASDSELGELLRILVPYGAYYCPHHRSYGKGALQAYREMIELARDTGVRLHLTHATLNFEENKGKAEEFITMVDQAITDGVDISLDTYPYLPGSTTLAALLPSWAAAGGGAACLERLHDPETLAQIRHDVEIVGTDGCHGCTLNWKTIEISGVTNQSLVSRYLGKAIGDVAEQENKDPFDLLVELLIEDNLATTILQHEGHEENVRRIMRHPKHCAGSDGILTSMKPHPRGWGTMPRYLGHYARDLEKGMERDLYSATTSLSDQPTSVLAERIFDGGLEDAVSHLTGRAAAVIGLKDRGTVKEGYNADLVLFDPESILDQATFSKPQVPAKGIRFVMVNGHIALDEGKPTGMRAGKTLRLTPKDSKEDYKIV
ncbi:putative D-aminoacylase [Lophiotrema nucula]|uniref:Putative D-aminoacylase n=1 Tax=Lophiotrema nucula TaxID=690887 RepID=A0A6A5Z597_9PLEO|nr:putative D-aminoacylase [Lophiotrema nucula]